MRQAQWSTALLNPELEVPEGVVIWNNSDPLPRFNVYRNNIVVSLDRRAGRYLSGFAGPCRRGVLPRHGA